MTRKDLINGLLAVFFLLLLAASLVPVPPAG